MNAANKALDRLTSASARDVTQFTLAILMTIGIFALLLARIEVPDWLSLAYGMIVSFLFGRLNGQSKAAPSSAS